ncbi:hypothetical protein BJ878DRAFT_422764 [Calycina marina]|uniref:RanBP2-type domain-containing protein n=1 Tax=Calycina marina TaxID=1763456 RepID=A0A9P8CEL3_9HELO|nr:hypothetical protein BJ878DRAFT_422764 [Calycina marina]
MASNGLSESYWAKPRPRRGQFDENAGDWKCHRCSFSNFSRRTICFRCNTAKCDYTSSRTENVTRFKTADVVTRGLEFSRFAPRKYSKTQKTQEVWTYVPRISQPFQDKTNRRNPAPIQLGLPYEVQHFILEMIRVILEEGCWAFGTRILPEMLYRLGYTCSEMVELSKWKELLPSHVSGNTITKIPNYTLLAGLSDAVKVRHAGTHRHLCDNADLQKKVYQSESLMYMFGDVSRQEKLRWLREEIHNWQVGQEGADRKRSKLEAALRLISEKPIHDMDWTPNSISLEELSEEGVTDHNYAEADDFMDID